MPAKISTNKVVLIKPESHILSVFITYSFPKKISVQSNAFPTRCLNKINNAFLFNAFRFVAHFVNHGLFFYICIIYLICIFIVFFCVLFISETKGDTCTTICVARDLAKIHSENFELTLRGLKFYFKYS